MSHRCIGTTKLLSSVQEESTFDFSIAYPEMKGNRARVFVVTGANSGLGLEAIRQLLEAFENADGNSSRLTIYMLCRSKANAKEAMELLGLQYPNAGACLQFLKFDALDLGTVEGISIPEEQIDGLLLNAGGFGDSSNPYTKIDSTGASTIAHLNILGHVALTKHLLKQNKLGTGSRIVVAGSESAFAAPGIQMDYKAADFKRELSSDLKSPVPGMAYSWAKGIMALYWSAFASRHPEIFVVTVSPGSVATTNLYNHGGSSGILSFVGKALSACMGSNSVEAGAKHYIDALLDTDDFEPKVKSGSFLGHRVGFAKDFGDITEIRKGAIFADSLVHDRAFEAVESFLP